MAKDNFSAQSKEYAAFRPQLQKDVYDFVVKHVSHFNCAWDVGTGNGQTACVLANIFQQVIATDISENQLAHAVQMPNIEYRKEPAEQTSIPGDSVDLITIAQAIHWFDFEKFYAEVRRVARPGAVIAAFSYSMFRAANEKLDKMIQDFYIASNPYWDPERKYIDAQYKTIPFPFDEIEAPVFSINYHWSIDQVIGYMRTWSANQHYRKKFGEELVSDAFRDALSQAWPKDALLPLQFPVYMRIGKVNG